MGCRAFIGCVYGRASVGCLWAGRGMHACRAAYQRPSAPMCAQHHVSGLLVSRQVHVRVQASRTGEGPTTGAMRHYRGILRSAHLLCSLLKDARMQGTLAG